MKINIYNDIIKSYYIINSYKRDLSLPIDKYNVDMISVLEFEYDLSKIENEQQLNQQLINLLIKFDLHIKCFVCESELKKKSKVRSYKGIVDKSVSKETYFQHEFHNKKKEDYSLICSLLDFNLNTIDYIIKVISNSDNSFLIGFSNIIKEQKKELVTNIYNKVLDYDDDDICVNYIALFYEYCVKDKNVIIRTRGDGLDEFVLQIFYNNKSFSGTELIKMVVSDG